MRHYLKKEWKINSLAALFLLAVALCEVTTNLLMIQIAQCIITFDLRGFIRWMTLDIGAFLLLILFDQLAAVYKGRAIRRMNNRVRLDMAATISCAAHQEYHGKDSGEYLSELTNDIHQMEQLAWNSFFQTVSLMASVAFSIAALSLMHWSLTAAALLSAAILLNAPKLFGKKMEAMGEECAEKQANGTSQMKDLLAGCDVLRSFGRLSRFMNGMKQASDQVEEPGYRLMWMKNLAENSVAFVSILTQFGINLLLGVLGIQGVILQGSLMGGGNICGAVSNGLANLAQCRLSFAAAKPYFAKIVARADEQDDRESASLPPIRHAITLENLSFGYGDRPVLDSLFLRFEKGGKYALTGPSGCGKSTVLKLILGYLSPDRGGVRFDGRDARDFSPEQIQKQISYIDQNVFLFNTTIRDNITLGVDFSEDQMAQALRGSALENDLAQMPLGLDTPAGENGSRLSGGQKQRVAIARALIHGRSVLLVDEGTSALDAQNAEIVEQSLLNNPCLTLILVSHHLTAERRAQFTGVCELGPVSGAV